MLAVLNSFATGIQALFSRATFSDDQWREEIEQRLYPAVVGRYDAISFSEKEKPYDLKMSTLYILLKAAG